jgi:cytochrome c-type biogenesis protein
MLWPQAFEWLVAQARSLVNRTHRTANQATVITDQNSGGNIDGFFLGTTVGIVWTPCAGPVLGPILTIIATSQHLRWEALLLVAYAIGAAVPMLAIAYGGQFVTTRVRGVARVSHRLQQGFGGLVIAFALAKYFQYDTLITVWAAGFYANGQLGL